MQRSKVNTQKEFSDFKEGQGIYYQDKLWMVVNIFHCRQYIGIEYDPYIDPSNDNPNYDDYDLIRLHFSNLTK